MPRSIVSYASLNCFVWLAQVFRMPRSIVSWSSTIGSVGLAYWFPWLAATSDSYMYRSIAPYVSLNCFVWLAATSPPLPTAARRPPLLPAIARHCPALLAAGTRSSRACLIVQLLRIARSIVSYAARSFQVSGLLERALQRTAAALP